MKTYNIETNSLYNDLDCLFDRESNKIDVYSSVYWTAENEEEYHKKESIINSFLYEDDLIVVKAWCDISGYGYWSLQDEENYVSFDVMLKKDVSLYSQEEIKFISDLIIKWDNFFIGSLL